MEAGAAAPVVVSADDKIGKFVKTFSSKELFAAAWSTWCHMLCYRSFDPARSASIVLAFSWHFEWMLRLGLVHSWSAMLRYHYAVMAKRATGPFDPLVWYKQVKAVDSSNNLFGTALRANPTRSGPSNGRATSKTAAGPANTAAANRSTSLT